MSTRVLALSFVVVFVLTGRVLADNGQSASPPERDVVAQPVGDEAAARVLPDRKRAGAAAAATASVVTTDPDTGEVRGRYRPSKDGEGAPK